MKNFLQTIFAFAFIIIIMAIGYVGAVLFIRWDDITGQYFSPAFYITHHMDVWKYIVAVIIAILWTILVYIFSQGKSYIFRDE